jgi:hypothetical protein
MVFCRELHDGVLLKADVYLVKEYDTFNPEHKKLQAAKEVTALHSECNETVRASGPFHFSVL